jgi:serine/threonine protein kinase
MTNYSQCLNPNCLAENPLNSKYCSKCRSNLLLDGRYLPIKYISEGGFGKTYLAIDTKRLNKPCVIKQFLPLQQGSQPSIQAKELFEKEAQKLEELGENRQIPGLLAFFEQKLQDQPNLNAVQNPEYWYLIQEYIEGDNLAEEIQKKGRFTDPEVQKFLIDILPVIQFIHEHKVVHKDIKPENIIRRNQSGELVLIDFGISTQLRKTVLTNLTKLTLVAYSPNYAAPEQTRGHIHYTSDLYSLAVTAIRLITGYLPEDDDELFDIYNNQWAWKEYLQQKGISVNSNLAAILDRMLASEVRNRYQSAAEILQVLQSPLTSLSQQGIQSPLTPLSKQGVFKVEGKIKNKSDLFLIKSKRDHNF